MSSLFTCITIAAICCVRAIGAESVIKDSQDMNCHVYTPDVIDPAKTYQLVVGVHGAGGKGNGAAGMKGWANRGDVIVIGPSFVAKGESPYQNGNGIHAEKLIALFETLKKTYKLKEQMFLHAFSGGSQFMSSGIKQQKRKNTLSTALKEGFLHFSEGLDVQVTE